MAAPCSDNFYETKRLLIKMSPFPSVNDNPLKDENGSGVDLGSAPNHGTVFAHSDNSDEEMDETSAAADDDDDDPTAMGYELLPQEPCQLVDNSLQQDDQTADNAPNSVDVTTAHQQTSTDVDGAVTELCQESDAANSLKDIDLDQDRIEKIKLAMAGFTLPVTSFPTWANAVPEDQWKDRLMSIISPRQQTKLCPGAAGISIQEATATIRIDPESPS